MTNELKPCPFCGGKAKLDRNFIICDTCAVRMESAIVYPRWHEHTELIQRWNTRYKRTCHASGDWFPVSQTQWIRIDRCSNCGYEFGMSKRNAMPFEVEFITELPNFCPQCGFRVCGAEVVDGD